MEGTRLSSSHRLRDQFVGNRWARTERNGSGDEFERLAMFGSHDSKVPMVQRRDSGHVETFRHGDDARIGDTEPEIGVLFDEFMNTIPIGRDQDLDNQRAITNHLDQRQFSEGPQPSRQHVASLSDHQRGRRQGSGISLQQLLARRVVRVVKIAHRDERTCIDDQHDAKSVAAEALGEGLIDSVR